MTNAVNKGVAILSITDPNNRTVEYRIEEENSQLIGSGANAAIRLRDPQIASVHCVVRFSQGTLAIDDWCSATGTIVNGERIDAETQLVDCDTVTLGSHTVVVRFATDDECPPVEAINDHATHCLEYDESDLQIDLENTGFDADPDQLSSSVEESLGLNLPTKQDSESSWSSWFSETDTGGHDEEKSLSFDEETIQLLTSEIGTLESELESRVSYIAELEEQLSSRSTSNESPANQQHLENRLQELLDELKRSDQRAATFEDLLQISDHATQVEKEERQQIESWVSDIECRISGREAEWQAEKDLLLKQIEQQKADWQRLEESLNQSEASANIEAQERAIHNLRNQLAEMEIRLAKTEAERNELQKQTESTDMQTMLERQQQIVEEAVREEQLAMARERAAFSRQKSELIRRVADLESEQCGPKRSAHDADVRFNAFRQHLKEIQEPEARPQSIPLTKRLVNLWNRLEHGPTDTE